MEKSPVDKRKGELKEKLKKEREELAELKDKGKELDKVAETLKEMEARIIKEEVEAMEREEADKPKKRKTKANSKPKNPDTVKPPVTNTPSTAPESATPPDTSSIASTVEEPILPPPILTPEEITLEKSLDEAREKYASAYKQFLEEKEASTRYYVLKDLKRGWRWINGSNVPDSEVPDELKALEAEYDKKAVEFGQEMFRLKQADLENQPLSEPEKKVELARFKQNEIFTKVIVEEQSKLNALKVENLPPKEKGVVRKSLDWYIKQPRWKKMAISVVGGTLAFAVLAPGSVAAAGSVATFAGIRALRGVAGMTAGQVAAKAFDYLFKEKSTEERAEAEKELSKIFEEETFDTSLAKSKKEYAEILERERKAKRNRLITKAMVGIAAGGATSLGISYGMRHGLLGNTETVAGSKSTGGVAPDSSTTVKAGASPDSSSVRATTVPDSATAKAQPGADNSALPDSSKVPPSAGTTLPDDSAPKPSAIPNTQTINPDAIIHKGEGIEHALRRQIEADPALAEKLGYKPGTDLHKFSGGAAHRLALDKGYVDKITGEEIRVKPADEIAYQIKTESNGEVGIHEIKVKDGFEEKHGNEPKFEGDSKEDYEYRSKKTPSAEEIKTKIEKAYSNKPPTEIHNPPPYPGERLEDYQERIAFKDYNEEINTSLKVAPEATPKIEQTTTTLKMKALPEFSKNPFHLTEQTLKEVLNIHRTNLYTLFHNDMIEKWDHFSTQRAKDIIENDIPQTEPRDPMFYYVRRLNTVTGLKPIGGFFRREETIANYVARALQKAAEMGRLDAVKLR